MDKKGQENGPNAEKDNTERTTGLGRRQRRYFKVESNWQPWDFRQGKTSEIPGLDKVGTSGRAPEIIIRASLKDFAKFERSC